MRWPDWLNLHKDAPEKAAAPAAEERRLRLEHEQLEELDTVFAAPRWLRDLGLSSWYLAGTFIVVAALAWLAGAAATIVNPLITAMVICTVAIPLVGFLKRHGIPRAAGAAIVLLSLIALAIGVVIIVFAGIKDQSGAIAAAAHSAASKVESWMISAGVNKPSADKANAAVSSSVPQILHTFTTGLIHSIQGIASMVFSASLLALSTFFILKDGPTMRAAIDRHMGVPEQVGRTISGGVIRALRGYFKGVTIVALFNGVVVGLGAWILGVPLAATIGIVTFVLAYIPFIGAFLAGAFAVVIALGANGTTDALIMLVIVILANGLLQNLMQPFAMGSALELNPLVVLVVTIGAGGIFGTVGLILAAPLLSAAVHIKKELTEARTDIALEAALAAGAAPD
jgi:putative heme transporter